MGMKAVQKMPGKVDIALNVTRTWLKNKSHKLLMKKLMNLPKIAKMLLKTSLHHIMIVSQMFLSNRKMTMMKSR